MSRIAMAAVVGAWVPVPIMLALGVIPPIGTWIWIGCISILAIVVWFLEDQK